MTSIDARTTAGSRPDCSCSAGDSFARLAECAALTTEVMLAVVFGALLHATWNVLAKSGGDPLIETTLILLGGSALALPLLPLLPRPDPSSWPFIAASSVVQVAYFALLGAAYRAGDMSLSYPLMRGTAPLLVAIAGIALMGESLAPGALAGIVLTCGGILVMTLGRRRTQAGWLPVGLALANASVIATYTLLDGVGARRSGAPFAYTLAIFVATCALFAPWVAWRYPASLKAALFRRWHRGLGGGACIVTSYGLALWAMTHAPIATVAALRESSILFGLLLARLALHERLSLVRVAGGLLILAGAGMLRLG